jgi:hypothetical protein
MVASRPTKWMVSKQRWLDMIDLLNRIGFRQIAFGGEGGGGGGGGGGSSDDRREARKKTGQANLAAGNVHRKTKLWWRRRQQ